MATRKKSQNSEIQPLLFDYAEAMPAKAAPTSVETRTEILPVSAPKVAVQKTPEPPRVFSVSEFSLKLRDELKSAFGEVLVQGEVADFKGIHRSGHLYFALKDEKSQVRAVMWKGSLSKLPFEIKAGLEVICTAKVDYYGGSGSLQLVVERMEPVGLGALQLKFEQLKEKLKAEGLFDPARKKPVRPVNWKIGIVTSKTGAALQDMLRVYKSRFPIAQVFVFHSAVQGERAPFEICRAIQSAEKFSQHVEPLDVLVVGRGGGSYEDLFCFNDESVVRAVAVCKIPTVSAVGHEIDVTLCDWAADKRSATPSHAASETVPESSVWLTRLSEIGERIKNRVLDLLQDYRQQIDNLMTRVISGSPKKRIENQKESLSLNLRLLISAVNKIIEPKKSRLLALASTLDALSPLKVLERGFSIAKKQTGGEVLRSKHQVELGDQIEVLFSDGGVRAKITEKP